MIRSLLKLALFVAAILLVYNYFLGTPTEKEQSKKVFSEVKDLGVSIKNLLVAEKKKFDKGKYDNAVDKIGTAFDGLREKAREVDENYISKIDDLERKRRTLKDELNRLQNNDENTETSEKSKISDDLKALLRETEQLANELEAKGN